MINTFSFGGDQKFIEQDSMAVARDSTSPSDGPPKLYIPRKLGRVTRISRAISTAYLRQAIKAYTSLLDDGSLPESSARAAEPHPGIDYTSHSTDQSSTRTWSSRSNF